MMQVQFKDPNKRIEDHGIEPGNIFAPRQNSEYNVPPEISCIAHTALCLCFPFACCCMCKTVKIMHDKVVTRMGFVSEVLRNPGLACINPCCTDYKDIYMGLQDIEIEDMKANDIEGNPLVVSAEFTYRVIDSVLASYMAADLKKHLKAQGEAALRAGLAEFPYDHADLRGNCLRTNSPAVQDRIQVIHQQYVATTGVKIENFRIYSIGIDSKMAPQLLKRQEAQAELIARGIIAEGSTGIVKDVVKHLQDGNVHMSDRDTAKFAMNLTYLISNTGGHTTIVMNDHDTTLPIMKLPEKNKEPMV